ncbi:MAG: hypothetical protein ACR2FE_05535 [Aeromicrobium sp.]
MWYLFEDLLASDDPFVWWPGLGSERRGDDIHVVAGSPLGYRLRFRLHDVVEAPMKQVTLQSDGDLDGEAALMLRAVNESSSTIDVTWHVDVTRPWMRATRYVLRPVFVLAHLAVMRAGERGLNSWLLAERDSDPVG